MAIKKTFTIEQLGAALVQYKYDGALSDHLSAYIDGGADALPNKYLGIEPNLKDFFGVFANVVESTLASAMEHIDGFDTLFDIQPVLPKHESRDSHPRVEVTKYEFCFQDSEQDPYGTARAICDAIDWDALSIDVNNFMTDEVKRNEGFCSWESWNGTQSDALGYDSRWIDLYTDTIEDKAPNATGHNPGTAYATFKLDEVIRRAANVKGRQWRNYCKYHELPVCHEAMDFTCWVLDTKQNFDEFLTDIGMVYDKYQGQVRPDLDTDIFAPSDNNHQSSNINTTMAQTNNNNTTAAKPWKAQAARTEMTASEYEALYYDRFFKEQLDAVKIDTEGHSLIDLLQVQGVTSAWSCNDEGSRVTFTITMGEGFVSAHTFDLKNNGSRTNETTIGGVTYKWISLAKMREAILKFDGDKAPADIQQYVTNRIGGTPAKTEEKPQPQKAPTAKVRKEPIAQQTVPQTTEQPKATEQPSITPAPSTTDATYHFSGDDHYYHLYRDEDGVNGGVVIVRRDGGLNSHIKHRDFAQLSAYIASKKMTKMEQLPDALMKTLVKEGVVKALKVVEKPKTEEKPQPKAIEQPKAEQPKTESTPQPNEVTGNKEKGEMKNTPKQTANVETPEAKVIPFTLPGEITISNIKTGSMTLNGLTDLTAEQISIFVAGMNAMREAIRKQMTANA